MMGQIQYFTHQLQYIIHLVNKFQIVITHKCKVIHIQIPKSNQIRSFLTILDSISRLTLICFDDWTKFNTIHINYNILSILSTNLHVVIRFKCKVIHIPIPKSNEIRSFLTLLDSICRLTLICIDDAPNSIR